MSAPERVRGLALICSGLTEYDWPAEMTDEIGHLINAAVPAERMARYRDRTAEYVDPADVRRSRRSLAVRIAGAKRVDLDAGHLSPIERPVETTRAVVEFVETVS